MNTWKHATLAVVLLLPLRSLAENSGPVIWDEDTARVEREVQRLRLELRAREAELRAHYAFARGDNAAAAKEATEALKADPGSPDAQETLALAHSEQRGDAKQIVAEYDAAVKNRKERAPKLPEKEAKRLLAQTIGNRGAAKFRARDLSGALADFEEALRLGTRFQALVAYEKADVLASLGRFADSAKAFDEACAAGSDACNMGNKKFDDPRILNLCGTLAQHGEKATACR